MERKNKVTASSDIVSAMQTACLQARGTQVKTKFTQVWRPIHFSKNETKHDGQVLVNVPLRRIRVTTVAMEKQLHIPGVCL